MQHAPTATLSRGQVLLSDAALGFAPKALLGGVLAIAAALLLDAFGGPDGLSHFAHAYLLGYFFVLSLALGALIFVCLQRLTKAGWSVVVRRVSEVVAASMPALAILFLPIVFMMHQLYPWTHHELVEGDAILLGKQAYLNVPFFLVRCAIYFAVWIWVSRTLLRLSLRQDESGDVELTRKAERLSAPAIILFALTITFAGFDMLMSLDPHWFSTIFGVYVFSGALVGFLALAVLLTRFLQARGVLRDVVTVEHYHDLGKLLFAFTLFWGYIAFSQFLLIWYANIPEETIWYQHRVEHGWIWMSYVLLFGHFVIPFCGLLSRHVKRSDKGLVFWAAWQLCFHLVDLYWLVMPALNTPHGDKPAVHAHFPLHVMDVLAVAGFSLLFAGLVTRSMRGINLVPVKDPRLAEARPPQLLSPEPPDMATQADDPPMSVLGLIFFASVIGTLVTVILLVGLYRHGEAREFKEKVIDVPVLSVQSQREQAQQRLASYGWVDREKEQVHIPIERAMALFLEEQRGQGR